MADQITSEHRSWNMAQIRSKDTKPEKAVRSLLHIMGYRFRLHVKDLPGKPDIVLPKYKTVVFVHGCYWHRHENCKYAYTPKSRTEFYANKFQKNIERHREVCGLLEKEGWQVNVIWECETRNIETLRTLIESQRLKRSI